MKIICASLLLYLIGSLNLYANEKIVEFKSAFKSEKPDTEIIVDKDVGKLFVEKVPFLTSIDIIKVNLIIDSSTPPAWLEEVVNSSGGKIISPKASFEFFLSDSGRKILKKISSEKFSERVAVFVDGNFILAPAIHGVLDSDSFIITTGYDEKEARRIVDTINERILNR